MSSNVNIRASPGARPLMMLAAFLENAQRRDDKVVSFPAKTFDVVVQARPPGTLFGSHEVQAIVLALDSRSSAVCERLDSLSLTILCSIFMYSKECLAQQRGLCLLATVLHRSDRDTTEEVARKQEKKSAIGRGALTQLFKGFLKTDTSDKLRRWLGILALELLKDCPELVQKLRSDPAPQRHWQYLGEVIEHGSCQVLKLLAGSMIREMLTLGALPGEFRQSETCSDLYSKFPRGQHHDSQWVTSFEEFVEETVLQKLLTQEVSSVIFAYAVHVGDRKWNLKEALDILVTVSEELNIMIPANEVGPAVYIDIPLNAVSEVACENALIPDSQQPIYGLVLRLNGGETTNCILNATGYAESHVAFAFSSEKDANTLRRLLMPTNFRANGSAPHDRSVATDASERILSDDELAAPGPGLSDNRMLSGTALQNHAIDFHGNAISTIDPSMLERVRPPQSASPDHQHSPSNLVPEYDEDRLLVGHNVEMAAEGIDVSQTDIPQKDGLVEQAIEGIDVSQIDGSSQGDLTRQDVQSNVSGDASFNARVQDSQVLDKWNQDFAGRSNRPRDIRMSSSLRLNTGLDAVENVPQSHTRSSQKIASSIEYVENRRGLPDQDGEYNNLYYASPRITKDHHKSPRILAKESVSRARERPSETTVRQASAEKVPPVKLSRQTRNAEGVAEVHTEQTADDGLTTMAKNHAVDVKASGNNSKGMASDPGKEKKRMQGVTAHGRKIAQTRGKAVANEELQGNSLGGDNEKAAKTWLKAKKAPHDNKKKARSVLTRAPNAASSRGYASELRDSSDSDPRASEPLQGSLRDRPNDKNVDDDDDAIWDIDQAYDEEECQTPRRLYRSAKKEKKQAVHMSKTEQTKSLTQLHSKKAKAKRPAATLNQKPLGRLAEAKPAPAPLTRSRPRRTAAIKANKKIQGLERSEDESVEDEGPVSAPTRSKLPSIAARRRKDQVVRNGGDDRPLSSTKIPTKKRYPKDFIPDSISPNSSDKGELNSRSDPRADSSSDKVILVKDASAKTLRAAASDKRNDLRKEVPTSGVETSAILLHPGHGEHPNHVDDISAEHGARDNFAHLREPIIATETAHINFQRDNDIPQATNDLNATSGLVIQDSVQDVAPCTDDELLERELHTVRLEEKVASSQAPKVLKTVQTRKTRSPLRPTESAEKSPPKPTSTRQDPFASKLNASMAQAKDTNPQTRSSKVSGFPELKSKAPNTSKLTEPGKSLQEYEATTIETSGAPSSGEAKHVKSAQKLVKSSMQVDDEDKGSLGRSSKRAGEKSSASVPKTKRKIEQARDTTNKKVKVTPNERLEGVLARNPGFNAEKTPPPVLNNKPLLIGFSASGPRNQGTISTKKSKNVKHVGTGASDQVESREHQVSNAEIDQVQADFTSNKEVLEPTSAVIQASVKVPGIAQQRDHASPWQKQHHEVVSAGATGEEQLHEKGPAKRKLASSVDDPAPFEHEQLSKRQKRDSRTPPTAQNHHPKMLPDVYPTLVHDRPHRLSSQNTRVNENGSPMPFFVNCEEGREALDQYSDVEDVKDALAEARLEEQAVLQNDELVISEPILPLVPLVSATSASNSKPKAYQSLSNNNKQLPSSPHACSAFGTMQPHHLYHDGKIVNAETKEFIVPNEPQDPFLSASQKPPNAFMDALRRSTVSAAKSPVPGANDKRDSGGMIMRQNVDVGEDPDKTLVEPHMKKRHKRVQVSETSSSPESGSSTQASPPNEASEEESEPETEVRWRKGLEPYQDNMLECLLTISHRLIRHLVDKETAIKDMVTDFRNYANSLVGNYEKGIEERVGSHRAYNDRRRQNLRQTIEKAQGDLASMSRAISKPHFQEMQAQWKTHQEALMRKVTAALEACAE